MLLKNLNSTEVNLLLQWILLLLFNCHQLIRNEERERRKSPITFDRLLYLYLYTLKYTELPLSNPKLPFVHLNLLFSRSLSNEYSPQMVMNITHFKPLKCLMNKSAACHIYLENRVAQVESTSTSNLKAVGLSQ